MCTQMKMASDIICPSLHSPLFHHSETSWEVETGCLVLHLCLMHMHYLILISNDIISQRSGCVECAWKPMTRAGGFSAIDALVGFMLSV